MGFKFHAVVLAKTILLLFGGLVLVIIGATHPAVFFGTVGFALLYLIVWAISVDKWNNYD